MREHLLWVEKYRPKSIEECILPSEIKQTFNEFVLQEEIPNLLLSGRSGIGKTTVAMALCNQMDSDFIIINSSEDGNIDTLRTDIKTFASTVSLSGGRKVVILDEADYLNPQSTQPALRRFMEEFSKNCRFIFTCNFANRIISPLHSRCSVIEFKIPKSELPILATDFMERIIRILKIENVTLESKKSLSELILKYLPDWRRVLNELQRYSVGGVIDVGILSNYADEEFKSLILFLKGRNFGEIRKWVVNNLDNDAAALYRKLYDSLYDYINPEMIPQAVLVLAEYSYKSAFVADQEINMVACLTEIMATEGMFQ
jgi:DNA polymerase III delta prime subunit